jgi:O-acetyl-ADP-ribose deacetylase (regulator of RNase III)
MMKNIIDTNIEKIWAYLKLTHTDKLPIPSDLSKKDLCRYYFITKNLDLPAEIISLWDTVLQSEINPKSIVNTNSMPKPIALHRGDITVLKTDAIVNAANDGGLGCFTYGHKCIDNVIHTKAGPQLRMECNKILGTNTIPTSGVIATLGYNLPCKYILHTVGPIYDASLHDQHCVKLSRCYINCLAKARDLGLKSIAFCCISTGVFGFPADHAADVAFKTVKAWLKKSKYDIHVIFCTYTENDYLLYKELFEEDE